MWKQKISISVGNSYSIPTCEVIKMLKQIGFDAISPKWEKGFDIKSIADSANECGLVMQAMHGPFRGAADLWSEDENISGPAKKDLLDALNICKEYNIPIMVMHTWIGFDNTHAPENLNFKNYDEIVNTAKSLGIKIAFENTEGEEFLFALMKRYQNEDNVGFCWDSGHEMCYNHSQDLLEKFGDRLIVTHLNDNLGISRYDGGIFWTDDLHLLPYDGIADWDYNIERLKNSKPLEYLNFELNIHSKPDRHDNDCYGKLSLCEYFTEAYKRACKIAYRYRYSK